MNNNNKSEVLKNLFKNKQGKIKKKEEIDEFVLQTLFIYSFIYFFYSII
jgi:hypothetical protein